MNIKTSDTMRIVIALMLAICWSPLYGQSKETDRLQQTIEKASRGESSYQSELVDYYYNTAKDYSEAIKWCNILMANENAEDHNKEYANRILGNCALEGTGMEKSIDNAIIYWKRAVEYKGGSCALALAQIYERQRKDSIEAIKWYKTAADLDNKTAAYHLAQLYENGFVIVTKTVIWRDASNKRAPVAALEKVKVSYPNVGKDISQASKYYDIYIKDMGSRWIGNPKKVPKNSKLLYKLAHWHYSGEGGLARDYSRAFDLFNFALECNGDSKEEYKLSSEEEGDALWCLSVCYRFGRGVEKDELLARRYVKRAAEKGNEKAISLLKE